MPPALQPPDPEALTRAITAAADAIVRWQAPDGSWRGRNEAGPMYGAASVAFEAALGTLPPDMARAAEAGLRAAQVPDGGLLPWPGARESNAEGTLFLLAAYRALGVSGQDPAFLAAERRLAALGGPAQAGPLALTAAAVVGQVSAADLPYLPSALSLLPGHDALVAGLLGVNSLLPLRTLPFLWEMVRRGEFPLRSRSRPTGLRGRTAERLEAYLRSRQNPSGGIAGVPFFTLLGLLCLAGCGVPPEDPAFERGLTYVRRVVHLDPWQVEPFESTYWDTAHMVRVLAHAPGAAHREAARRGAAWLLAGQSSEPSPPDWQTPPPGAPTSGGWSWQPGNERNPDFDTTAEVLSALGTLARVSEADRERLAPAIRRGVAWLLAFQNPDGGWAAFSWGKPRPPAGALYLRGRGLAHTIRSWLAENGDPSTADIVGRVHYGLAMADASLGPAHPGIARSLVFLREHQVERGGWWGRWAVNYLSATAYIVGGLAAIGEPMDRPWIQRALTWMERCQNPDGGWGESTDSYVDPERAGQGPSTVALTGLVAWALQRAGRRSAVTDRALAWLLTQQRPDGSFTDTLPYSTMFPLRAYWINDGYPTFFALEALLARGG